MLSCTTAVADEQKDEENDMAVASVASSAPPPPPVECLLHRDRDALAVCFSFLSTLERGRIVGVCRYWQMAMCTAQVWKDCEYVFPLEPSTAVLLPHEYRSFVRRLVIEHPPTHINNWQSYIHHLPTLVRGFVNIDSISASDTFLVTELLHLVRGWPDRQSEGILPMLPQIEITRGWKLKRLNIERCSDVAGVWIKDPRLSDLEELGTVSLSTQCLSKLTHLRVLSLVQSGHLTIFPWSKLPHLTSLSLREIHYDNESSFWSPMRFPVTLQDLSLSIHRGTPPVSVFEHATDLREIAVTMCCFDTASEPEMWNEYLQHFAQLVHLERAEFNGYKGAMPLADVRDFISNASQLELTSMSVFAAAYINSVVFQRLPPSVTRFHRAELQHQCQTTIGFLAAPRLTHLRIEDTFAVPFLTTAHLLLSLTHLSIEWPCLEKDCQPFWNALGKLRNVEELTVKPGSGQESFTSVQTDAKGVCELSKCTQLRKVTLERQRPIFDGDAARALGSLKHLEELRTDVAMEITAEIAEVILRAPRLREWRFSSCPPIIPNRRHHLEVMLAGVMRARPQVKMIFDERRLQPAEPREEWMKTKQPAAKQKEGGSFCTVQ